MKKWEVSLWPNNQPQIVLGRYVAPNGEEAIKLAICYNKMKQSDRDYMSATMVSPKRGKYE